jgi:Lrp/AsnC family transcriptional regulator, leucine-responsive regulatory protein
MQQYAVTVARREIIVQTTLDRTDLRILAALQTHGRITNADLAAEVNLSPSACLRRVQKLESDGVIAGYGARLDPRSLGLGLQAFVRVQLSRHDAEAIDQFTERVAEWDEVVSCYALTGDMDYLLQVHVADLDGFSRFLLDRLLNASGVADVNTSFVLRTVKASTALPLGNVAV